MADFDIKKIIEEMACEEERAMARREVARAANKWIKICAGGSLDKVPDELAEALIDKIILTNVEKAIMSGEIQVPAAGDKSEITSEISTKSQESVKADKNKLWELFNIEMGEGKPDFMTRVVEKPQEPVKPKKSEENKLWELFEDMDNMLCPKSLPFGNEFIIVPAKSLNNIG